MRIALYSAILLVLFGGLMYIAADLPFGGPAVTDMDDYFIDNGQARPAPTTSSPPSSSTSAASTPSAKPPSSSPPSSASA